MAVDSLVVFKVEVCQSPVAGAQLRERGIRRVVHNSKEQYNC